MEPPSSNQKEYAYHVPSSRNDDYDSPSNSQGSSGLQGDYNKLRNKKKRGSGREKITLGGLKKVEVATKRKAK